MQENVSPSTQEIRDLILRHRPAYIRVSEMELRPYASLVDTAGYVAKAMLTNYGNNVMLQYGSTLQGAVNTLLKCQQCRKKLVDELEAKHMTAAEIKCECETQIWGPARRLKESLGTGQPDSMSEQEEMIIGLLQPVLDCYSIGHKFQMDSIYYDAKVHPLQHLKAFVQLNMILAREKMRFVQALPLQHSWVYSHVPLNTAILVRCIFDEPYTATPGGKKTIKPDIRKHWGRAVDLEQDMFRSQKGHQFLGFAMTDGVSISAVHETKEEPVETSTKCTHDEPQQPEQEQLVVQQAWLSYQLLSYQLMPLSYHPQLYQPLSNQPMPPLYQPQPYRLQLYQPQLYQSTSYQLAQQPPPQTQTAQQRRQKQADCQYISELTQEQLQSTAGRCILVDP
ncbi:hypothetical protein GGH96_006403, partial [Coemansia sp. RSA 1972]